MKIVNIFNDRYDLLHNIGTLFTKSDEQGIHIRMLILSCATRWAKYRLVIGCKGTILRLLDR